MKKTNVLWFILNSIFLIVFNTFFFMLGGTEHSIAVWTSYGFIHFAYIMLLLTPFLVRKGKSKAVFGLSIYSISSVYFIFALIAGCVFILIARDSFKVAFLTQLCMAGLYGLALITNILANEYTAKAEVKRQSKIDYVKNASAKLKSLSQSVSDREVGKKIEKAYDAVFSSPVKSHPDLMQAESQILASIKALEESISAGDMGNASALADSLLVAVNERNSRLKTHN